jgi:hypothetical protein
VPQRDDLAAILATLVKTGASVRSTALVGSHATRYSVATNGTDLVAIGR